MPNFKARCINLSLPFKQGELEFLYEVKNSKTRLVLTKFKQEKFFLQIKAKNDFFIIKAEKISKSAKTSYLAKALAVFKENFCEESFDEYFAFKNLSQSSYLLDFANFSQKLKTNKKIYIEIGFGSGRHLLYLANNEPDCLVFGIEIYTNAINQVENLINLNKLNNIFLLKSDARALFSVLPSKSIDKIFLHFPVPWPKNPKRRVISSNFIKDLARILKFNASFELRTDSKEYFEEAFFEFLKLRNIKVQVSKNQNLQITSKYETRWLKQQKDIYTLCASCFTTQKTFKEYNFYLPTFSHQERTNIKANFKALSLKKKNYFLHIEELYSNENQIVIKLAFGNFNYPANSYIEIASKSTFVFEEPYKTKENLTAFKEFNKILKRFALSSS